MMMGEYINYFLFVVGFCVFIKRPKYAPLYFLMWSSLFAYFIDCFVDLKVSDTNLFESLGMNYIWACCLLFLISKYKLIRDKKFVFLMGLFLGYVVVLGAARSCLMPFQGWLRGYFCFVPMWIIIKNSDYSFCKYSKLIYYMLLLQLFLAAFQQIGVFYPSYAGKYAENGAVNILGTFRRYNDFACGMSLLVLSYLSILISQKKKIGVKELFIIFSSVVFVYRSGARTEVLGLALSLCYLLWRSRSQIKIKKIVWPLILILVALFSSTIASMIELDNENAERQQELVEVWNGERSLSEKTTLFLSVILLEDYFSSPSNILTGSGKLYKEGYGGWISSKATMWDSDLALYLAETGMIGIMFYVLFLCRILKDCEKKAIPIAMIFFLVLTSITDYGMFEGKSAVYFLFLSYFLSKDHKKCVCKEV